MRPDPREQSLFCVWTELIQLPTQVTWRSNVQRISYETLMVFIPLNHNPECSADYCTSLHRIETTKSLVRFGRCLTSVGHRLCCWRSSEILKRITMAALSETCRLAVDLLTRTGFTGVSWDHSSASFCVRFRMQTVRKDITRDWMGTNRRRGFNYIYAISFWHIEQFYCRGSIEPVAAAPVDCDDFEFSRVKDTLRRQNRADKSR